MAHPIAGYWYSRWLCERVLAAVYVVAFACAVNQFIPLLGQRGLLPASRFVHVVPFRAAPSLFYLSAADATFRAAAWTGLLLSCIALTGVVHSAIGSAA